jgi:UDP-4-amino-4,6-dideoxy-N-acetyl-beta-L-altrosamine N-acetyltransferase
MLRLTDFNLRPVREVDSERLLRWRNSEHVRVNMYADHVIGADEHARWFNCMLRDPKLDYRICEYESRPIGLVAFTQLNERSGRASWALYLGEKQVPQGAGAAMEYLALEYAFGVMHIRKLSCEVLASNTRVVKLHKRFGFKQEGIFVGHVRKNNGYQDVVVLALFASDWPAVREQVGATLFAGKARSAAGGNSS